MQQLTISCASSPHKDLYKSVTTNNAINQLNQMLSNKKDSCKESNTQRSGITFDANIQQQSQFGSNLGSTTIKKKLEQMKTEVHYNSKPQIPSQESKNRDTFLKSQDLPIPTCKIQKRDSFYSPIKLKKEDQANRPSLLNLAETFKEKRQTNKHISSSNMFDKYKDIDSVQKFKREFSHDYNQSLLQKNLSSTKSKGKDFQSKQGIQFL